MTAEEAIAILDPETRRKTLREIPVMDRIEADQEACRIAVAALRNLLQTSEPLTLKELREMDGEPVWVCHPLDKRSGAWALIDLNFDMCRVAGGGLAVFENCGKTWLAYRRKPEARS